MNYTNLQDIEAREIMPGFYGKMIHSANMTFAYWEIDAGTPLVEHSHPHEQVVNMLEGQFEIIVDGESRVLGPGDIVIIPSNALHTGRAITECKILDVFQPVREDYR